MVSLLAPSFISLITAITMPMVSVKRRLMPLVILLLALLLSIIIPSQDVYLLNLGYIQLRINDMPLLGQFFLIAYWIHLTLITSIAYREREWNVILVGLWQMVGISIALTAGNFTTIATGIEIVTLVSLVGLVISENSLHDPKHRPARLYAITQLPAGILIVVGSILVDQEIVVMPAWYGLMGFDETMTAELGHNLIILGLLLHLGAPPLTMVMPRCYSAASPLMRAVIAPTSSKLCLWIMAMTYGGIDWLLPCGLFIWAYGMIYACCSRQPEEIAVNYQLQMTGLIIAALSSPAIETNITILALVAVQVLLLTLVYTLLYFREHGLLTNHTITTSEISLRFGMRLPTESKPKTAIGSISSKVTSAEKLYRWQGRLLGTVWLVVIANLLPLPGTSYYDLKHDILGYMYYGWLEYCWIIGNIAAVYYLANLYRQFNQTSFYNKKSPRLALVLCGLIAFCLITPPIYRWAFSQFSSVNLDTETSLWGSIETVLITLVAYKAFKYLPELPTLKYDLLDLWRLLRSLTMALWHRVNKVPSHIAYTITTPAKRALVALWEVTSGLEHNGTAAIRLLSVALLGLFLLVLGLMRF